MIHLIQVLKRDLPSQYDVSWIDLCQAAYVKNGIYDLDYISEVYQTKVYDLQDKIVVLINASKRVQEISRSETSGHGQENV